MATKFASLNELPNLQVHTYKKGDRTGARKLSNAREDEVGERLAQCNSPSDVADFASLAGITDEEIAHRAASAPNFGQFRMTLGNRIRHIVNVMEAAQRDGKTMTKHQAAALGAGKQFADPKDLPKKAAPKPKAEPKPKPKAEPKPKPKPATKKTTAPEPVAPKAAAKKVPAKPKATTATKTQSALTEMVAAE